MTPGSLIMEKTFLLLYFLPLFIFCSFLKIEFHPFDTQVLVHYLHREKDRLLTVEVFSQIHPDIWDH